MNKVNLTGRLTDDIEVKKTAQNKSIANFSIAVDRAKKDTTGNKITDFIRVHAWENKADFLASYTQKGSLIGVSGRIETSKYQNQQGVNVTDTYIVAEQVEILKQPENRNNQSPKTNFRPSDVNDFPDSVDIRPEELPFY